MKYIVNVPIQLGAILTRSDGGKLTGQRLGTRSSLPLRKLDMSTSVPVLVAGEMTMRQSTGYACITQSDMAPLFVELRGGILTT